MNTHSFDFEWLADLEKSQCFTTYEVSKPAKSSDFGSGGYTASVTDWHELLQLTAPDETCGIVFVRGHFPNTPDAILSRSQRRDDSGNKGTFGTRLNTTGDESDLELGERLAQGWINLRWPYTKYELRNKHDNVLDLSSGSYEQISFIRDGVLIQVIRLKWGHESSLSDYDTTDGLEKKKVRVKIGGVVQFGCPCSNRGPPDPDSFHLSSGIGLACVSERYKKTLEMHLFIDGIRQDISTPLHGPDHDDISGSEVDASSVHEIELRFGEPVINVSTCSLRDIGTSSSGLEVSIFTKLEDYLGISNTSIRMTDRLWTALCSANYEASEAVDVCVIGRGVEQILGVSSVPLEGANGSNSSDETALICNIMTPQYVNVQSSFFQIRLLVKAYNFIRSRHLEPDLFERFQPLVKIRAAYLSTLLGSITSILTWLINTDMKPRRLLLALRSDKAAPDMETQPSKRLRRCEQNRVQMHTDQSYNQACYATLAVWYVMNHCPQAASDTFKSAILLPKLTRAYEAVQKRASRDKEPTPKNDVLQWLHMSCLFLICNGEFITDTNKTAADGFSLSGLDRQEVIRTQQKFEKYVSRLKTAQADSYSIENEELDRVLLVSEELELDAIPASSTASLALSRARQSRKIILQRQRTTRFNPGPKTWKGSQAISNGPWELQCTNHQGSLRVTDDANIKAARDRLFEFLMSDYSFMTSWDRADGNMVGKWWDIEPVSVICATLLDLKFEGKLKSPISEAEADLLGHSVHDIEELPSVQRRNSDTLPEPSEEDTIRDILLQMKKLQEELSKEHLMQMRQLLVQEDIAGSFQVKAFDWVSCKPGKLYHPDRWVQSIQDTPDLYQAKQTKDVPLRKDVRQYLARREGIDIIAEPSYTPENINSKLPAAELQFLGVFDLHLSKNFTFKSKDITLQNLVNADRPLVSETGRLSHGEGQRNSRVVGIKKATDSYNYDQLDSYRKVLLDKLNDSLVDIGAKHRILFAEKCTPVLVGAFIYMFHPDGLDTFDNYFGSVSRFTESREVTMWATSITISYWSIRPVSISQAHAHMFKENRNNGDFPPTSIARLGSRTTAPKRTGSAEPTDVVEERCSSIVITGDPAGHLWICSIWSSLTDSESITQPIHALSDVLQRFIHQQACGRCLAFLLLLGHLCEKLAGEYEMILSRLDVIVGLGEIVLLEGLVWGTNEAVDRLKKMLWGLEALRVFNDRLSASLSQIKKAQEAMARTVKHEAGQQHVDLLQEFNNVIEEFEKRYGMLSDVQVSTQLKIIQVTGFRDGISTVANVEDSQTALRDSKTTIKQGNNIRILTYITIAYLPLGFITGLFAIEHADFMNKAGNNGFAILTVIFILGTYTLALSLENIIEQWERFRREKWGRPGKVKNASDGTGGHDTDSKMSAKVMGTFFGLRRRREHVEENLESEERTSKAA
ncbi:hypothetical protein ONS95_007101 [Cadophora gregata]|uniref:uncharacterized protein n=1 Tax=Cadophora gregata TaxID=51156 RepID=UPI0026DAB63C|nr:uncharacterized protein ONS95_007101 [Cadophora gregata]KAK0100648.1 hypothetical protein ONS95_007101 [Cadophora gregata]